MLKSGTAYSVVDLKNASTYAEARAAVINWIGKNPEKAADFASPDKDGVGAGSVRLGDYEVDGGTRFQMFLTDGFMAKINALNGAAADTGLSAEELYGASRKLFEGSSPYSGNVSAEGFGAAPAYSGYSQRPSAVYTGKYAENRLNKTALSFEMDKASRALGAFRGTGRGPAGAERYYESAMKAYSDFSSFASPLKSRNMLNDAEAETLERTRLGLRRALAGLSLRIMTLYTEDMSRSITDENAAGFGEMRLAIRALLEKLDAAAASAADSRADTVSVAAVLVSAHAEFGRIYMRYSVYRAAEKLGVRSSSVGYSCLYDYLISLWLARISPRSPMPVLRQSLAGIPAVVDASLARAASGDVNGVVSDGKFRDAEYAVDKLVSYSAFNRRLQFFFWGLFFRPFEVAVRVSGGRIKLVPEMTFFSVRASGKRSF